MPHDPPVLLFEDDDALAEEIVLAFGDQDLAIERIVEADAFWARARGRGSVLVVDRLVDGVDSLIMLERLQRTGLEMPCVVISSLATVDERIRGLKAGGDDYIVKPFAMGELLARVAAVKRRARHTARPVLEAGPLRLDLLSRTLTRGGRVIDLLPREYTLLEYFMRNAGVVVTRAMLLEDVWRFGLATHTNAVDVHVGNLRRKIEEEGEPRLITSVRGVGFRLSVDGEP